MPGRRVHNYERPLSLGGSAAPGPDGVTFRWFGTACFEVAFGDRVLLLDNFYERAPRNRPLGFTVDEVTRADLLLVGHPHHDHVSDTVRVARQTGAPAVIAPLGADLLGGQGLAAEHIVSVTGLGDGEHLDFGDFAVRALHGFHLDLKLTDVQFKKWAALREARAALDAEFFPPPSPDDDRLAVEIYDRGIHTPEVNTQATLTYVIDIDGFRVVYRDSGGELSEEERRFFEQGPGCDVAILAINGSPVFEQHIHDVFLPMVELYRPRVVVPAHHDELWTTLDHEHVSRIFVDGPSEPIKTAVHDAFPDVITAQPGLIEPLEVNRRTGEVVLGELPLR